MVAFRRTKIQGYLWIPKPLKVSELSQGQGTFSGPSTTRVIGYCYASDLKHIIIFFIHRDSKDKILPLYSDYATAVLVGTLEQYRAHVSYITSVSRNILFIATDLPSQYEEKYFEGEIKKKKLKTIMKLWCHY